MKESEQWANIAAAPVAIVLVEIELAACMGIFLHELHVNDQV